MGGFVLSQKARASGLTTHGSEAQHPNFAARRLTLASIAALQLLYVQPASVQRTRPHEFQPG